jgi:hypothetical protein
MSQFYKTHLAFSRGYFEAIFVKNTPGCLGVNANMELKNVNSNGHNVIASNLNVNFFFENIEN